MPAGAIRPSGSGGENIQHFGGVRMRVVGAGELEMTLISVDEVRSSELLPFTLEETTDREPFRLANFVTQRAQLEVKTDRKDEYFYITRILVYMKPIYSGYPT